MLKKLRTLWREPLVHFLLIGVGLFLIFELARAPQESIPNRIVVSADQVEQLAAQFKRTWLRPPTQAELEGIVDNFVRDEVYYREALAMGLDREDPLVRRRMRQKLEFILEDLSSMGQPDDKALNVFLHEHADRFRIEPSVAFNQIYLNVENHLNLDKAAQAIIAQLQGGADPTTLGDPTLMAFTFNLTPQSVVARSFGEAFAQEVVNLKPGNWTGPVFSGMGAHVVQVTESIEARMPELTEVRAQVEREYMARRRQEMMNATYDKLLLGYEVVIEPVAEAGPAVAATTPEKGAQ